MRALISWAVYFLPSTSTFQPLSPMWRLTDRMMRSGLVMAWRLATSPTSTSPVLEKPTTDGVVRPPSALGMTVGSPASRTETTALLVPRSIPTSLAMSGSPPNQRTQQLPNRRPGMACPMARRAGGSFRNQHSRPMLGRVQLRRLSCSDRADIRVELSAFRRKVGALVVAEEVVVLVRVTGDHDGQVVE